MNRGGGKNAQQTVAHNVGSQKENTKIAKIRLTNIDVCIDKVQAKILGSQGKKIVLWSTWILYVYACVK